jgi:hypothetical protein
VACEGAEVGGGEGEGDGHGRRVFGEGWGESRMGGVGWVAGGLRDDLMKREGIR